MIREYYRPSNLDEALRLVKQPTTVPLGGGTMLSASSDSDPIAVVDLQSVGLSGIKADGNRVSVGAMTLLQDLVDSPLVPTTIQHLAQREAPNTLRNAATMGGTIVTADPESELLVGLLVYETTVTVAREDGSADCSLEDVLSDSGLLHAGIITAISIASDGRASAHRTGRTPADRSIVAVVARQTSNDETLVAASGVGPHPTLINPDQLDELRPPADFRGSSEYRSRLVAVLTRRSLEDLGLRSGE